jgi:hypothetical protein
VVFGEIGGIFDDIEKRKTGHGLIEKVVLDLLD